MKKYIDNSKDLIDYLLVSSDALSDKEYIIYVFDGLYTNYTSLITHITNKKKILTLDELYARIRMHEKQ